MPKKNHKRDDLATSKRVALHAANCTIAFDLPLSQGRMACGTAVRGGFPRAAMCCMIGRVRRRFGGFLLARAQSG